MQSVAFRYDVRRIRAAGVLFLPPVVSGPDPVKEIDVWEIAQVLEWREQRRLWAGSRPLFELASVHSPKLQ